MKKGLLRISAILMALVVLFVSVGWDVKFHYCTIDHELTGSFNDAAKHCAHCAGHHHHEKPAPSTYGEVMHFQSKCCCDDFDQLIQFSDNYVNSSEIHVDSRMITSVLVLFDFQDPSLHLEQTFQHFTPRTIPVFSSCKKMLIFLSSLKLNPLVF